MERKYPVIVVGGGIIGLSIALTVQTNGSQVLFIAIVFLSKPALRSLRDFERQEKLGVDPVFDPKVAGIENAELWEDISREYHAQGIGIEPKEKQNKGMVYQEEEGKN